jgi:hypothetical protein
MDAGYLRLGHGGSFQQNYTYLLRINSSMIPITQ